MFSANSVATSGSRLIKSSITFGLLMSVRIPGIKLKVGSSKSAHPMLHLGKSLVSVGWSSIIVTSSCLGSLFNRSKRKLGAKRRYMFFDFWPMLSRCVGFPI